MPDSNITDFGNLPGRYSGKKTSKIIILPVPYDGTSTWIKGADRGPEALLSASANLELYDIETDTEVFRKGIFTDDPVNEKESPDKLVNAVYRRVRYWLSKGKFVVTLGGEHTVSIGAIKAYAENIPGLSVLQIDAHADLRNEYEGSRFNHCCVMARVGEICPFVQVGIRSMDSSEKRNMRKEKVVWSYEMIEKDMWINKVISLLSEYVYVTFDLDAFDPSIMPSTGTPEPGGLTWNSVMKLFSKLTVEKKIVGFDVNELCPIKDLKAPDFLAAKLVYKILSYRFKDIANEEKRFSKISD